MRVARGAFGVDAHLTLKLEYLQHTGSFKPRGVFNRVLSRAVPPSGLIAASGGNHGMAVAYAARVLGVPAQIIVPTISSAFKRDLIARFGASITIAGDVFADALEECNVRARNSGALEVHAYEQPETIAGQGTLAFELERQVPDLDTLLVSVGGGGLLAGLATWYEGRLRLVGVEPSLCPTVHAARAAGRLVDVKTGGRAADALGCRRAGAIAFDVIERYVAHLLLVSEDAIAQAQQVLWEHARIIAEPSGAVPLAALLSGAYRPTSNERVGMVICGANVDPASVIHSSL
jgi:threonine dehydratase